MRTSIAWVVALAASACAARAPSLPANHPADPAAPAGRLAGPPAILRAARPAAATTPEAPKSPEHDHAHH